MQTIPGKVLNIQVPRRRPLARMLPRRPRWFQRRRTRHHGMPMRPHPMIAWRPVITWHNPMWWNHWKRPMMNRRRPFGFMRRPRRPLRRPVGPGFPPEGGPQGPLDGPQRPPRPAGPGFRPANSDDSSIELSIGIGILI